MDVTSSFHQGEPCFICGKEQPRYDHFCALTTTEQHFLQQYMGTNIAIDSCMCCSHHKDMERHISDPSYVPVWVNKALKNVPQTQRKCKYPEYNATLLTEKIFVPSKETQAVFYDALSALGTCIYDHECTV